MSYLGESIKKLGFGLMRLPKQGDSIDIEQVKVMVDRFMAAGFTYDLHILIRPGRIRAVKMPSVKLWLNVIPESAFSWPRKMPPGSIVKPEKKRLPSLIPR